jgi:DNA (cytosine-5)-methyltransferase 1
MARVISEVQPPVVWVENSPMLRKRGLARVLGDLAKMGYDAKWGIVGAHHAGAKHKRDRIWILAYTNSHTSDRENSRILGEEENSERKDQQVDTATWDPRGAGQHEWQHTMHGLAQVTKESTELAHTNSINEWTLQDWINQHQRHPQWQCTSNSSGVENTNSERFKEQWVSKSAEPTITKPQCTGWWAVEPGVGRVAHGVPSRVDRLKSIGNAQCPQAMALAWHILSADD